MSHRQHRSPWPLVHVGAGTVVAVVVYLASTGFAVQEVCDFLTGRRQDLYAVVVGVHTTMLGFALATLTVVLGYAQSPRFQVLRDSRWFGALFSVFTNALRAFALAFAVALLALLFDRDGRPEHLLTALVGGTTVTALASLVHLLSVLEKVVHIVITNPARPAGA
jgi:hypothetical protein